MEYSNEGCPFKKEDEREGKKTETILALAHVAFFRKQAVRIIAKGISALFIIQGVPVPAKILNSLLYNPCLINVQHDGACKYCF